MSIDGAGTAIYAAKTSEHGSATRTRTPHHQSRLPALDGIRGIAVMLVVFYHVAEYQPTYLPQDPSWLVPFSHLFAIGSHVGWIGGDLFFVLSGFLITGILLDARDSSSYFGSFYRRRAARILPAYYVVLLVYLLVLRRLALPSWANLGDVAQHQSWYWTLSTNLLFVENGWHRLTSHLWSLAVEEQFYLLWPLCVYRFDRQRLLLLCGLTMAVSVGVRVAINLLGDPLAAYVLTPARLDALAAGAIVALLAADEHGLAPWRRLAWCVAVLSAIVFAAIAAHEFTTDPENVVIQTFGYSAIAIMFAAGLVIALSNDRTHVARWLSTRPLRLLGQYSYGLYVFHHPVLFVMPPARVARALEQTLGISLLARPLAIAFVAAVCCALAVSSWHLFEQPVLKLRERSRRGPRGAHPRSVSRRIQPDPRVGTELTGSLRTPVEACATRPTEGGQFAPKV